MKISFEQIKTVTVGAVAIKQTERGIRFYKCTQKQLEAWYALSQTLGTRAETTTGVRLDFHTNSRYLTFSAEGGRFDVYLNDVLRLHTECNGESEPIRLELTDALGGALEECRVTLVFPSHGAGLLKGLELEDGATVEPHKFDTKLLFIGDSITQGWDSGYDSLSYAWRVSRFFNADSVIHGVGGGYFHETVFDSIPFDPDTVIIAFGTNDFGRYKTQDSMREQTRLFLEKIAAEYASKRIFVISPIWRAEQEKTMGTFREARQIVIDEATRLGLRHIDGLSLVPPLSEFYADKTLHPNALGFSLYAEALIAQLV